MRPEDEARLREAASEAAHELYALAKERRARLAFAESCTGGLAAELFTDIAGASAVFWGAAVSYSEEAKRELLGLKSEILGTYGPVSEETAKGMADGLFELSKTDLALAVTGWAGPFFPPEESKAGKVILGWRGTSEEGTRVLSLKGTRSQIRLQAARELFMTALMLLRERHNPPAHD